VLELVNDQPECVDNQLHCEGVGGEQQEEDGLGEFPSYWQERAPSINFWVCTEDLEAVRRTVLINVLAHAWLREL